MVTRQATSTVTELEEAPHSCLSVFEITSDTVTPKLLKGTALIEQAIGDQLEAAGQEMEATARQIVPVDTGFLRSTIYHKADPSELTLELGAKADYAFFRGIWN